MHSEKVGAFRANRTEKVGAFRANKTRNWLQARLSVYPAQNYLRPITSFKSNMQKICQKYLFSIIILHENPPYV